MKTTLILILLSICYYSPFAQKVFDASAYIKYEVKFVNDTNNREKPLNQTAYTIIGKEMSAFVDELPEPKTENTNSQSFVIGRKGGANESTENYVYEFSSNQLIVVGFFGEEFMLIVDPKPEDYTITSETKEIGGYQAQKATIDWKGRSWEIWFTKELPFSTGPWKFTGLPGLILSAKDKTGEISYEYAGFDKFDEARPYTVHREKIKKLSYLDYIKTQKVFDENIAAYLDNTIKSYGSKVKITDKDGKEMSMDEMKANLKKKAEEEKKRNNNRIEF